MRLASTIAPIVLSVALTATLFGQEDDADSDISSTQNNPLFSIPAGERTFSPEVIRASGCSEEDTRCLELAEIRHALRLPDGFSREPDCVEDTVCVSQTLTLRHDDFVAILDLVSPQVQRNWVNIGIQDVLMMRVVLVTAESERLRNGQMEWIDGGKFLVEQTPQGRRWSILRQSIYHLDLAPSDRTGDADESDQ